MSQRTKQTKQKNKTLVWILLSEPDPSTSDYIQDAKCITLALWSHDLMMSLNV